MGAAATRKALFPTADSRVRPTISDEDEAERSHMVAHTTAGWIKPVKTLILFQWTCSKGLYMDNE